MSATDDFEATEEAIDWLMAVRKYGLERANEMFPENGDDDDDEF
jgi:hypothetical protein